MMVTEKHKRRLARFEATFFKNGSPPEWIRKDDDTAGEGHFPYRFDSAKLKAAKSTLTAEQRAVLKKWRRTKRDLFT